LIVAAFSVAVVATLPFEGWLLGLAMLAAFVMYVQRWRPIGGLDWFIMPMVILLLIGAAATVLLAAVVSTAHGMPLGTIDPCTINCDSTIDLRKEIVAYLSDRPASDRAGGYPARRQVLQCPTVGADRYRTGSIAEPRVPDELARMQGAAEVIGGEAEPGPVRAGEGCRDARGRA
jgi:hypothetical protein